MGFGVDTPTHIPGSVLAANGVTFVCRYIAPILDNTIWKLFGPDEPVDLAANGVWMVSNYEWYESRCTEGYATGYADAQYALAYAIERGMPEQRPIYFSVDQDTTADAVSEYFRGACAAIGVSRVGVYGSYGVCKDLRNAGRVSWTWQTYAWSGGNWASSDAFDNTLDNIEQYQNTQKLQGYDVDYDRSLTPDFGQWMPGRLPDGANTGDDMTEEDRANLAKLVYAMDALLGNKPTLDAGAGGWANRANVVHDELKRLEDAQAAPAIDYAKLAAALIAAVKA